MHEMRTSLTTVAFELVQTVALHLERTVGHTRTTILAWILVARIAFRLSR